MQSLTHILQWTAITEEHLCAELVKELPLEFLKSQHAIPVVLDNGEIAVALANAVNVEAYDAIVNRLSNLAEWPDPSLHLGRPCQRIVCPEQIIENAISFCYYHRPQSDSETAMSEEIDNQIENDLAQTGADAEDLLNISEKSPAVKLVNTILFRAIQNRASDVHIEPYETETRIRYRVDGVLHDVMSVPPAQVRALQSRLKIMASLNIAETRLPQDGQSRIKIGQDLVDVRVSVIPTLGGERIVLRILDKGSGADSLDEVGFDDNTLSTFRGLTKLNHGIILLTGPTGSGKTTTLYAALHELNSQERNILTVEDPVEYQLAGIGQMQVRPKIDLTFANCLRHILRQDPDVIMVGEIRDRETAQIAIQAALTGHLVFSTLHTNDAASAVTRLIDMGIEPYLITSTVVAVLAQRLIRRVCPECKALDRHSDQTAHPEFDHYQGTGCDHCLSTGYFGRTAISELLLIDDSLRDLIVSRSSSHMLACAAVKQGLATLRDNGLTKAFAGITTLEEVYRVTQDLPRESKESQ